MTINRFDELSSIRKAASGAAKELRDFERAVKALRKRVVRGAQQRARTTQKRMVARYERLGLFADRRGALRKIRPFGQKHRKRKRQLKLDMRRGIMRKGVLKTIKSPRAILRTPGGFIFDLKAPGITVTGRATVGKSKRSLAGKRIISGKGKSRAVIGIGVKVQVTNRRSFRVNSYIDHFADSKAPGLGTLSREDIQDLDEAAQKAADEHIKSLTWAARAKLGKKGFLSIEKRIDKVPKLR